MNSKPTATDCCYTEPMLAKKGNLEKITADRYLAQPKLNGIRAMWHPAEKVFYSRSGNCIQAVDHLISQMADHPYSCYPLDGEIYVHGLSFQKINGLAGRNTSSSDTAILEFHVFDIALGGMVMDARADMLAVMPETSHVKQVETDIILSVEGAKSLYQRYLNAGYEGMILRKKGECYCPDRSDDLLKIKPAPDLEAELIGFAPGAFGSKNKTTFGSLILRMPSGVVFKCAAGLTDADRKKLWRSKPVGALVTVQYGALSDQGTPVFPRFSHLRWDTAKEAA
jgi:DNA ligase 1